jgi:hypothetical protein
MQAEHMAYAVTPNRDLSAHDAGVWRADLRERSHQGSARPGCITGALVGRLYNRGMTDIHTRLIDAFADPLSAGVEETFDDDIRFRSPFADYAGSADVAHLVGLIRDVLVEVEPVRQLHEPEATISLFDARVAQEDVQGFLFEQHSADGRLVDVMLTIRPYSGLRAAMKAMQARMEAAPLPSAR